MLIFEKHKALKTIFIALGVLAFTLVYGFFNPEDYSIFPKCPFYALTGLQCPGCGSQRAVHHILNIDFVSAIKSNALLIISIPYLVMGVAFDNFGWNQRFPEWRRLLFGKKAIRFILIVIISFFVLRNMLDF